MKYETYLKRHQKPTLNTWQTILLVGVLPLALAIGITCFIYLIEKGLI